MFHELVVGLEYVDSHIQASSAFAWSNFVWSQEVKLRQSRDDTVRLSESFKRQVMARLAWRIAKKAIVYEKREGWLYPVKLRCGMGVERRRVRYDRGNVCHKAASMASRAPVWRPAVVCAVTYANVRKRAA